MTTPSLAVIVCDDLDEDCAWDDELFDQQKMPLED
jgi:hypothetical protein